jgi:hypothetical protein
VVIDGRIISTNRLALKAKSDVFVTLSWCGINRTVNNLQVINRNPSRYLNWDSPKDFGRVLVCECDKDQQYGGISLRNDKIFLGEMHTFWVSYIEQVTLPAAVCPGFLI